MDGSFRLVVLTPERRIFDGPVTSVTAPGHLGDFSVLPGHVAYIAALVPGALQWDVGGDRKVFATGGGYAQVGTDKVSIVVSRAEDAGRIDAVAARRDLDAAEKQMCEHEALEQGHLDAQHTQALALARLAAVDRAGAPGTH